MVVVKGKVDEGDKQRPRHRQGAAGSDSQGAKRVERLSEETELKVPRKSSSKVFA